MEKGERQDLPAQMELLNSYQCLRKNKGNAKKKIGAPGSVRLKALGLIYPLLIERGKPQNHSQLERCFLCIQMNLQPCQAHSKLEIEVFVCIYD